MKSISPSQVEHELRVLVRDEHFRNKVATLVQRETKTVTVVSPYPLNDGEMEELRIKIGIKGELVNEVDPSLILGLIVKSNSYYVDYSLKGRIERIINTLK